MGGVLSSRKPNRGIALPLRSTTGMKAQHRHELQTNVLADRMGRLIKGMKSGRESTSSLIWGFTILAVVTLIAWQFYSRSVRAESSRRWMNLDSATHDPYVRAEQLENF